MVNETDFDRCRHQAHANYLGVLGWTMAEGQRMMMAIGRAQAQFRAGQALDALESILWALDIEIEMTGDARATTELFNALAWAVGSDPETAHFAWLHVHKS